MNEQIFCPECGTKIKADSTFCPNCGHKLTTAVNDQNAVNKKSSATRTKTTEKKPEPNSPVTVNPSIKRSNGPIKKGSNKKIIIVIAALIILVIGYLGLKDYYQPQKQLNRIVTAFGDPNKNLSHYITTNDPTLQKKVNEKNLKPIQKYFSTHKQDLADLKTSLQDGSTYLNSYNLEKSSNAWLLFPKYKVSAKAAYVTLTTNHGSTTFYQDGKKVAKTTDSNLTKNVGPLFPGKYTFKSVGTISGKRLTAVKDATLTAGSQDLSLKLHTVNFTVKGETGATVYLNNKNVGKIGNSGNMKFENYPVSGNLKVYLTIPVAGKTLKSKTIDVESQINMGYHSVYPEFEGVVSKSDAKELLNEAFSGTESGNDDSTTADLFTGSENNDSYNNLVKFFNSFNSNSNISSYDVEISKVNSVTPASKNKATVSYSVKYTFHTSDDSGNTSTKVQQFTYANAVIVKSGQNFKLQTVGTTSAKPDWEKEYDD